MYFGHKRAYHIGLDHWSSKRQLVHHYAQIGTWLLNVGQHPLLEQVDFDK